MQLADLLQSERALFDGAMGTLLQSMAQQIPEGCPEALNITDTAVVTRAHAAYAAAGSRAVETNTLGATEEKLARTPYAGRAAELNQAAVRAARAAIGPEGVVALSIGSTGELLAPMGPMTAERAIATYREQVEAGFAAGADVAYIETMMDLAEARCAGLAAGDAGKPFVISFTFQGSATLMGNSPESCALCAQALGACAVGINCSGGPDELLPVLQRMRAACALPVIVQPNAGLPEVRGDETCYPLGPEAFADKMVPLLAAGAAGVGGCCGTTPEHIARLREKLLAFAAPPQPTTPAAMVCSGRRALPLAGVLENAYAVDATVGEPMDAVDEALCAPREGAVLLDLSGRDAATAVQIVAEVQAMCANPLLFKLDDGAAAEAVLRAYHGVAGLLLPGSEALCARYGAHPL